MAQYIYGRNVVVSRLKEAKDIDEIYMLDSFKDRTIMDLVKTSKTKIIYCKKSKLDNIQSITPNKYFIEKGQNIPEIIKEMPVVKPFPKGTLENIIAQVFKRYKTTETSSMLDKLKDLGFKYSTVAGITISISDVVTSNTKNEIIAEAKKVVD